MYYRSCENYRLNCSSWLELLVPRLFTNLDGQQSCPKPFHPMCVHGWRTWRLSAHVFSRSSVWDEHSQLKNLDADSYKLVTISWEQYRRHRLVGDAESFLFSLLTPTHILCLPSIGSEMRLKSLLEALGTESWEWCYEMNRANGQFDEKSMTGAHWSGIKLESSFTCQTPSSPQALLPIRVTGVLRVQSNKCKTKNRYQFYSWK